LGLDKLLLDGLLGIVVQLCVLESFLNAIEWIVRINFILLALLVILHIAIFGVLFNTVNIDLIKHSILVIHILFNLFAHIRIETAWFLDRLRNRYQYFDRLLTTRLLALKATEIKLEVSEELSFCVKEYCIHLCFSELLFFE